jgi:hypothetical protein
MTTQTTSVTFGVPASYYGVCNARVCRHQYMSGCGCDDSTQPWVSHSDVPHSSSPVVNADPSTKAHVWSVAAVAVLRLERFIKFHNHSPSFQNNQMCHGGRVETVVGGRRGCFAFHSTAATATAIATADHKVKEKSRGLAAAAAVAAVIRCLAARFRIAAAKALDSTRVYCHCCCCWVRACSQLRLRMEGPSPTCPRFGRRQRLPRPIAEPRPSQASCRTAAAAAPTPTDTAFVAGFLERSRRPRLPTAPLDAAVPASAPAAPKVTANGALSPALSCPQPFWIHGWHDRDHSTRKVATSSLIRATAPD